MIGEGEKGEQTILYRPTDSTFTNENGTLKFHEDRVTISATFTDSKGKKYDLADFLPEGYVFIGEGRRYHEYIGAGGDTSFVDRWEKRVYLAREDIEKHEWAYLLMLFHEIGHAIQDIRGRFDEDTIRHLNKVRRKGTNEGIKEYEKHEAGIEREAWAIGIFMLKRFAKEVGIPYRDLVDNVDIKDFVATHSFGIKLDNLLDILTHPDAKTSHFPGLDESKLDELYSELERYYLGALARRKK